MVKFITSLFEPVAGYSRYVSLMKYGLWLLAFLLVGWLLIMPLLNPVHERYKLNFSSVQKDAEEKPVMSKPRFQGVDDDGQPFYITADTATQKSEDVIVLKNINGDLTGQNGGWSSILADDGTIYTDKNELQLFNNVHFYSGDGYEFRTEKAIIYTKENVIEGDVPIQGQGPAGTIDADRYRIENGGQKIIFKDNVRLVIYPQQKGDAQ